MQHRLVKLGLVGAGAFAAALPLLVAPPAFADYAPQGTDVVGVGSDTLQNMLDFGQDGFPGTSGFNASANRKLVSFDATADGNVRLAYGPDGAAGVPVNNGTNTAQGCSPGTGGNKATGLTNSTSGTQGGLPCVLNPTITLRNGTSPTQRPNGSGAGFQALANDILSGNNGAPNSGTPEIINFTRSSSIQFNPTGTSRASAVDGIPGDCNAGADAAKCVDSVQIGNDAFGMVAANSTNSVPLSTTQLKDIYSASTTTSANGLGGVGCVTWNEVGGVGNDPILAIIPQVGSGTRSTFLSDIGLSNSTYVTTNCIQTGEENDPTAIFQVTAINGVTLVSPPSMDAVEPMSGGRLNLYKGLMESTTGLDANGIGTPSASGFGPYFLDPSCAVEGATPGCIPTGSSSQGVSGTGGAGNVGSNPIQAIVPAVTMTTTGTPSGNLGGGAATLWYVARPLFVYFRNADVDSTFAMEAGGVTNWVRTLFYNPCDAAVGGPTGGRCTGPSANPTEYGPGGTPYFEYNNDGSSLKNGVSEIELAGVTPQWAFTLAGA
jgi:hypothetical protein